MFGCVTRVPSCELHLHFFFFPPSFLVSYTGSRNVFLCPPLPCTYPSPHTHVPSHLSPLSRSQCAPHSVFPGLRYPHPRYCYFGCFVFGLPFACAFRLVCGFVLCSYLFQRLRLFTLGCLACGFNLLSFFVMVVLSLQLIKYSTGTLGFDRSVRSQRQFKADFPLSRLTERFEERRELLTHGV